MNLDHDGLPNEREGRVGFTLIELVVVMGTLAVLSALLLPAMASTKPNSKIVQCLNNQKQLALAWIMYSDDNNELLVNLSTYNGTTTPQAYGTPWRTDMHNGLGDGELAVPLPPGTLPNTGRAQLYLTEAGFRQPRNNVIGPLSPYCKNPSIVHCPGDRRYQLPVSTGYNGPYSWDSYSGVAFLNGEGRGDTRNISKRTAIKSPAARFIWVEAADMRGENVGSWYMQNYGLPTDPGGPFLLARFEDSPAAFHVTSACFNYVDGHAEAHKWQDASTLTLANSTDPTKDSNSNYTGKKPGNPDAIWVASHYPGNHNP